LLVIKPTLLLNNFFQGFSAFIVSIFTSSSCFGRSNLNPQDSAMRLIAYAVINASSSSLVLFPLSKKHSRYFV